MADTNIQKPYKLGHDGMSSAEREKNKSQQQRSEDIAYTINHALVCTATDFIDPFVGKWSQKLIGKKFGIGCGHDHGADAAHGKDGNTLKSWLIGEFIGDFGAVPFTIAAQRWFPTQMGWLNKGMEITFGSFFEDGARKAAKDWAMKNNLATDSPEAREKAQALYENEVGHLAQTAMWTASAIGINLAAQKYLLGNNDTWMNLLQAKGIGSTITAGLVMGTRAAAPEAAGNYDKWTANHIINPITNTVNGVLGVDAEGVERAAARAGHAHGHETASARPNPTTKRISMQTNGTPSSKVQGGNLQAEPVATTSLTIRA